MKEVLNITLIDAGKKFGKEWIFRNANLEINQGEKIVILGLNGSGKSTLLQALTGYLSLNEGGLIFKINGVKIDLEDYYKYQSLASPYLELVEDFTLQELVEHTSVFKPFLNTLTISQVIELSGLSVHKNKYIKLFSSGMKQRLKLTLSILTDTPLLFLDEPTTNLDSTVINWYQNLITNYASHKTIIVCSNSIKEEYAFCNRVVNMEDYKLNKSIII